MAVHVADVYKLPQTSLAGSFGIDPGAAASHSAAPPSGRRSKQKINALYNRKPVI